MKFSPIVQYLRGFAAIMVLCYHVALHWIPQDKPHYFLLSGGVDIFFVISGLVMWSVTAGKAGGAWRFLSRRLKRIVPLYWIMTTLMLAVLLIHPTATLTSKFELWHVISSYVFMPAIHPVKGTFEPLLFPGWTLNYEMMFYALFTLALFAPLRWRLGFILVPLVLFVLTGLIPHSPTSQIAFYSNTLLLEFGMGCVLGLLIAHATPQRLPSWFGGALILLGAISLGLLSLVPWLPRGLAWGVPAALFVSGCVFLEQARGATRIPALLLVGDASYSIYLSHVLVLSALFQAAHRIVHDPRLVVLASIVMVCACIGAGIAVYLFIERPIIKWLKEPRALLVAAAAE
ncbi:MAG TPA: acyltransferase [Caulobacteraceae bacterium]|jgi:peptidoglycan/LPS O-acetylase OafA/YrhL